MADDDGKTIFNDPDKLKRTRQNLADEFQTGTNYGDKLKSWMGIGSAEAGEDDGVAQRRKALARQMVYGQDK